MPRDGLQAFAAFGLFLATCHAHGLAFEHNQRRTFATQKIAHCCTIWRINDRRAGVGC